MKKNKTKKRKPQRSKATPAQVKTRSKIISQPIIDIKEFQSKVKVRQTKIEDYDKIIEIQKMCFPNMTNWSKDQMESQLSIFPDGQLCIEYDGEIVASSSSLIIDFEEYDSAASWSEISDGGYITNHDPDGDSLYGIEIMVHPDYQGMKLARRLYDARKELVAERNLRRIVLGGRIPGYDQHQDSMSPSQYVEKLQNRTLFDPVLTVQLANGFVLKKLIPDYLSMDIESKGYATFLEWINLDYTYEKKKRLLHSEKIRVSLVQYQLRAIENFDDFATQCEYFVDVASGYKSDFAVFPELITIQLLSFVNAKNPALAVRKLAAFTPRYLELFSELAIKYDINIIGGSHFTLEDETLKNVAYCFQRDGTINRQYKIHITPSEKRWWGVQAGNSVDVFNTDVGKIAILICYDIEFPELSRIAADKGAEIIFVPFCTDDKQAYLRVRYCAQARAIENQLYVCTSGTVGNLPFVQNMDINYAQSAIYTPSDFFFPRDGIAVEANPNSEMVVV
ncbi:MAG: GNAT family N-acetyltransferase, partial [Bdellovibrionales bacterium]|nr:GNAT family N-acetyltransferase [Bdellovibrionales bacterium]